MCAWVGVSGCIQSPHKGQGVRSIRKTSITFMMLAACGIDSISWPRKRSECMHTQGSGVSKKSQTEAAVKSKVKKSQTEAAVKSKVKKRTTNTHLHALDLLAKENVEWGEEAHCFDSFVVLVLDKVCRELLEEVAAHARYTLFTCLTAV